MFLAENESKNSWGNGFDEVKANNSHGPVSVG